MCTRAVTSAFALLTACPVPSTAQYLEHSGRCVLNDIMDLFTHSSCDGKNSSNVTIKSTKHWLWVQRKAVLDTALLLISLEIWICFLAFPCQTLHLHIEKIRSDISQDIFWSKIRWFTMSHLKLSFCHQIKFTDNNLISSIWYLWPWTMTSSCLETANYLLLSNFVKPEIRI